MISTPAERNPKVLLVDEDSRNACVLAKMLREDGYEVEIASDADEAIARFSIAPAPDVLLTDFRLPHADGVGLAQFVRARELEIPVMIYSAHAEIVSRLVDRLCPRPVVLSKPIAYDEIAGELDRVLHPTRRSSRRATM